MHLRRSDCPRHHRMPTAPARHREQLRSGYHRPRCSGMRKLSLTLRTRLRSHHVTARKLMVARRAEGGDMCRPNSTLHCQSVVVPLAAGLSVADLGVVAGLWFLRGTSLDGQQTSQKREQSKPACVYCAVCCAVRVTCPTDQSKVCQGTLGLTRIDNSIMHGPGTARTQNQKPGRT